MDQVNNIRILSRKSELAVIQAKMVGKAIKDKFPNLNIEHVYRSTKGDADLKTPLSQLNDTGVFTQDLREDLIKNMIHENKLPLN